MAAATDAQVQDYVDTRDRPRCEMLRGLRELYLNDKAALDPVYANLTAANPTWTDDRTDVPQNVTEADVTGLYITNSGTKQANVELRYAYNL